MTKYYKELHVNTFYKVTPDNYTLIENGEKFYGIYVNIETGLLWDDLTEITKEEYESAVKEVLKRIEDENR